MFRIDRSRRVTGLGAVFLLGGLLVGGLAGWNKDGALLADAADRGAMIDPNGHLLADGDRGAAIDPNGRKGAPQLARRSTGAAALV